MNKEDTLKLVVDTCVVRSAGTSEHPSSSNCRKLLQCMLNNGYYIVMSREIREEWNRHMSMISAQWLGTMIAKKLFIYLSDSQNSELRNKINQLKIEENKIVIMEKDIHLVEAALKVGNTIISTDDEVRNTFLLVINDIKDLNAITWINPVSQRDKVDKLSKKNFVCLKECRLNKYLNGL